MFSFFFFFFLRFFFACFGWVWVFLVGFFVVLFCFFNRVSKVQAL